MENIINIEVNLLGNLMWCPDKKQKIHNIQVQSNIQISELLKQMNVPIEQVNFITKNKKSGITNRLCFPQPDITCIMSDNIYLI